MQRERFVRALTELAPANFIIHLQLTLFALALSILLGVGLGILLTRSGNKGVHTVSMTILNMAQTIPAFAFVALSLPLLGFGYLPTVIVLLFQGLLPIAKGTLVGISGIRPDTVESAEGMGMTKHQILRQVQLPLAVPYILSGVRTSASYIVSVATLAGFVGAGGLGVLISGGIARMYAEYLIVGAGLTALISIVLNKLLVRLEVSWMKKIFGADYYAEKI